MSQKLQPVRGTQDILSDQSQRFRYIDNLALKTAECYGFEEISTPIFEFSEVFHRTLGETSDAVAKETYTFKDRGGDELTLRPEGTAGIARAFISNGLQQNLPLKFYYSGPMFRYERPQKGRYRQFHQIGIECLGLEDVSADVECLALAQQFLEKLGLGKKVRLELNSLGDKESRLKHRDLLVSYLKDFTQQLSEESQQRLERNPLRILDSKDENDKKIIAKAPLLKDCLNEASKDFFARVKEGLTNLGISYQENSHLVRGLDYYTHTVFEFTTDLLGAQSAVLAGGRYDGLIEIMGGPKTPGIGWAAGLERLALLIEDTFSPTKNNLVAILPADSLAENFCSRLAYDLRSHNTPVELLLSGNMGKKMKRANKIGARYAIIIGESELSQKSVMLKDLSNGEQKLVPESEIKSVLSVS